MKYIARKNTWFDEGTEVEILDEYEEVCYALCRGFRKGVLDEEICGLEDFEEIE